MGNICGVGEEIEVEGVKVKTFPTEHTAGATAFYWENDVGTRILVTGDVKDASKLPSCDVLITEANYGDPADPTCHFTDDLEGMKCALFEHESVAFGAYEFGKAQRAVELIRGFDMMVLSVWKHEPEHLPGVCLKMPGNLQVLIPKERMEFS